MKFRTNKRFLNKMEENLLNYNLENFGEHSEKTVDKS